MTRAEKDLQELKEFMAQRWMSASDLAGMLIAICKETQVPLQGALIVGEVYADLFINKETAE